MPEDIEQARSAVVARYGELARAAAAGDQVADCDGCFGAAAYDDTAGLPEAALRASLGCGNPVAVADLGPGETVLDLGSGGGVDVLLSAQRVGPAGYVYGLDASPDMIGLARANAAAAGAVNVEFLHGAIEDVPLPDGRVDAVISNCVVNLSADKPRVLAEAFRVLRPGGVLIGSDSLAGNDLHHFHADDTYNPVEPAALLTRLQTIGFARVTVTVDWTVKFVASKAAAPPAGER
jgi:SAM-dependent methyltransferase